MSCGVDAEGTGSVLDDTEPAPGKETRGSRFSSSGKAPMSAVDTEEEGTSADEVVASCPATGSFASADGRCPGAERENEAPSSTASA
jgi:hypothetical protein